MSEWVVLPWAGLSGWVGWSCSKSLGAECMLNVSRGNGIFRPPHYVSARVRAVGAINGFDVVS